MVHQVRNHNVTVVVNKINNLVLVDRNTLAKTTVKSMQATKVECHDDVPQNVAKTRDKYFVERIVCHKDENEGTKYLLR